MKTLCLDLLLDLEQREFIRRNKNDELEFSTESSLIRIVKKDRNISTQKMRKSDYKDIESKVKSYINSHIKQSERKIKGIYGRDHNEILSSIKSIDSRNALRSYVKYSFEQNGKSELITLKLNLNEKIQQKVEISSPTADQGNWADEVKQKELDESPTKESGNTEDVQAYYKMIDNYLDSIKEKGFAIFKYSEEKLEEKLDENSNFVYEIYTIEDFYQTKVMLNANVIEEEEKEGIYLECIINYFLFRLIILYLQLLNIWRTVI